MNIKQVRIKDKKWIRCSLIKIGVLGYSSIAKRSVIPAINECDDFVLDGIGSRDIRNGKSYEELLGSDVDAIYVSLPVGLHYEWGKKVLESGKHLLMEKTFTESYGQAKELFDLASELNLSCMEALMYEFHPLQNQIDSLLSTIGDIRCVEAHFGFPYIENKNDIRYQKDLGGGAILDNLIYPLSFVFRILGDEYINYEPILFYDRKNEVDERGYIQFQYDTAIANISYGFGHSYRNEVTVWGDESTLIAKRVFSRPKDCDEDIKILKNGEVKSYKVENIDHFVEMLNNFKSYIDPFHFKFRHSSFNKIITRYFVWEIVYISNKYNIFIFFFKIIFFFFYISTIGNDLNSFFYFVSN